MAYLGEGTVDLGISFLGCEVRVVPSKGVGVPSRSFAAPGFRVGGSFRLVFEFMVYFGFDHLRFMVSCFPCFGLRSYTRWSGFVFRISRFFVLGFVSRVSCFVLQI